MSQHAPILSRLIDHHVHTRFCGHATGEMEDYVETAIARGLGGIGFSEHFPAEIPIPDKVNATREEMAIVVRRVDELREAYRGRIRILLGGEVDYFPGREEAIAAMLRDYSLDYVIGSVHFVEDWPVDHPDYVDVTFGRFGVLGIYKRYFAAVLGAIRSGLFDIIGHLDVVKKFGHRPEEDWSELADEVAAAIGTAGMCVDVNTAGLDKPVAEIYPSADLLRRCAQHGAGATLGSDAHAPGEVGRYFNQAVELVRGCGFTSITQFQLRHVEHVPLD